MCVPRARDPNNHTRTCLSFSCVRTIDSAYSKCLFNMSNSQPVTHSHLEASQIQIYWHLSLSQIGHSQNRTMCDSPAYQATSMSAHDASSRRRPKPHAPRTECFVLEQATMPFFR